MQIFTVGHSTREQEKLIGLLLAHGIQVLIDIRTIPRSRKNPQFNREELQKALPKNRLSYEHWRELGGLRKPRPDSENLGWQNGGFRGYADYMQTAEFEKAIVGLIEKARAARLAVMCAEGNPYRCHRSLLSDALSARGVEVRHIGSPKSASEHRMTRFAHVEGIRVSYPSPSLKAPKNDCSTRNLFED